MKKLTQSVQNVFAAISFAEQGEWDDAVKISEGGFTAQSADGQQKKSLDKSERRVVDTRPRLRV